jgi:hypothetical protein
LGVVVVAGCAVAGGLWTASVAGREPVLALARAVDAGQPLAEADLRVVLLAGGGDVGAVPAAARASVVGRPAAVPLPAGGLLTRAALGASMWPPVGQARVAVAVKPGQAPVDLGPGDRVGLVAVMDPAAAAAAPSVPGTSPGAVAAERVATGVVVGVSEAVDVGGERVLSVLVPASAADRVAAAAADGGLALVGLPAQ